MEEDQWSLLVRDDAGGPLDAAELISVKMDRINRLARELQAKQIELDTVKEQVKNLEQDLVRLFPQEVGTHEYECDDFVVMVAYGERDVYDKAKLAEHFGDSEDLPPYIKRSYSVDARVLKSLALTKSEQDALIRARTRKLSGPNIQIVTKDATLV